MLSHSWFFTSQLLLTPTSTCPVILWMALSGVASPGVGQSSGIARGKCCKPSFLRDSLVSLACPALQPDTRVLHTAAPGAAELCLYSHGSVRKGRTISLRIMESWNILCWKGLTGIIESKSCPAQTPQQSQPVHP